MAFIRHTLTVGNYAFSGIALLLAVASIWMWIQAVIAWGNPGPYANAMLWSFLTALAFAVVISIEWVQAASSNP